MAPSGSDICEECGGPGEVPTQAHKSGSVYADGGTKSCTKCLGTGFAYFLSGPKGDALKAVQIIVRGYTAGSSQWSKRKLLMKAAVKRIEEQFKESTGSKETKK